MYNKKSDSENLFKKLKGLRANHERIWDAAAQYTLPHIFMTDEVRSGGIEPEDLLIGDSIGAECLNNLVSQVGKVVFPPNGSFFTIGAKKNSERFVEMKEEERAGVYRRIEDAAMAALNHRGLQAAKKDLLEGILGIGDVVFTIPKSRDDRIQTFDLNNLVIKKTQDGRICDVIVKEPTEFRFLTAEARAILEKAKPLQYKHGTLVNVYSHMFLNLDNKYEMRYEVDGEKVNTTVNFAPDWASKFQVATIGHKRGANYGVGIVVQYLSLIHKANVLADAATETAVAGSLVNWAIDPTASVRPAEFANREQGQPFGVKPDAIRAIQADVGQHLATTEGFYQKIATSLARVFLLPQAFQRDAERVTAQEIRSVIQRLEEVHSGLYTTLAEELQRKLAHIGLQLIEDDDLREYIPDVEVNITTAMEALSRGAELENMMASLGDTTVINSVPPQVIDRLKMPNVLATLFNNRNNPAGKYIMSEEEYMQNQADLAEAQGKAAGQSQQQPELAQTQVFQQNTGLLESLRQPLI